MPTFTVPKGVTLDVGAFSPGVTVQDFYGGQRVTYETGADLAPINLAISQAVNANNPALAQRNYRDFIDRSALDYAEIERRKADSNLNTAIGLLAAAAMPYAAPALGSLFGGGLLGSAIGGSLIGGATAAATGGSIVEGVLTGGLSGGLAGVPIDPNVQNVLSGAQQAAINPISTSLAAVSSAGPVVQEAQKQDTVPVQVVDFPEYGATSTEPVIIDVPVEEAGGVGGGASSQAPSTATTDASAPTTGGAVQGDVSDAQDAVQAGSEVTTGVDSIVANQILEAILAETDASVRGGLINDWENYTGETFNDTLLPDYQDQQPVEPIGYVWGDGVWAPVFDEAPSGDVIFEPGANKPDYNPNEQQDEVVDVIDAAGTLENVLDSTIDADTTEDVVEPIVTESDVTEPVDSEMDTGVDTGTGTADTGTDESVDVGGEGTGTGEGSGAGEGTGEGDGSGDGIGIGVGGMMAAAAGASFEPKWTELFKYTTLTPYQKKTLAPYVDYIAQARGMAGRGMLS